MAKDESYARLSFSTCFAGAAGSLLTYVVGKFPNDIFWGGMLYLIPPITLVTYTIIHFVESRLKDWWDSRTEKADVEFIVKECDNILKEPEVASSDREEVIAARNFARMSVIKNKVERLKKRSASELGDGVGAVRRNRTNKSRATSSAAHSTDVEKD